MTDAPRPVRRRPANGAARGSKVASTGVGLATMLGLTAAMGYANQNAAADSPEQTPIQQSSVVVALPSAAMADAAPVTSTTPADVPVQAPSNAPIVLEANPVVRQAPAVQAPSAPVAAAPAPAPASTHGSR